MSDKLDAAFRRLMDEMGFTSLVIVGFRDDDLGSVSIQADATQTQLHAAAGYILRSTMQATSGIDYDA